MRERGVGLMHVNACRDGMGPIVDKVSIMKYITTMLHSTVRQQLATLATLERLMIHSIVASTWLDVSW